MCGLRSKLSEVYPEVFSHERTLERYEEALAPYKDKCILAWGCAAEAHQLAGDGFYIDRLEVYCTGEIKDADLDCVIRPGCFEEVEYMELHGFYVTTVEQTLLDLLDVYSGFNHPGLYFSLIKYYLDNGSSFKGLEGRMNKRQSGFFNRYKKRVMNPNIPVIIEKVKPYRNICRVCMESAAEFWGLTDGGLFTRDSRIKVYSDEQIDDPNIEVVPYPDGERRKSSYTCFDIDFVDPDFTVSDLLSQDIDFEDPAYFMILANYIVYDSCFGLGECNQRNGLRFVNRKIRKLEPLVYKYVAEHTERVYPDPRSPEEKAGDHERRDLNIFAHETGIYRNRSIIAGVSAAYFHGLHSVTLVYDKMEVYTEKRLTGKNGRNLRQRVVPNCFDTIEHSDYEGFHVTTEEKTLTDLLDRPGRYPKEVVYISLLTYYIKHKFSFDSLGAKLSDTQKRIFAYYKDKITRPYIAEMLEKVMPYSGFCQVTNGSALDLWGLSEGRFYEKDKKIKVNACQKIDDPDIEIVDYYFMDRESSCAFCGLEVVQAETALKKFLYNRDRGCRDALVTSFANYRVWESFAYTNSRYNDLDWLAKRPLNALNRWMAEADKYLAEKGIVIPESKKKKREPFTGRLGTVSAGVHGQTIFLADY